MKTYVVVSLSILVVSAACQSNKQETANTAAAEEPTAELTRYACDDNQSFSFRNATAEETAANGGKKFIFFAEANGPQTRMEQIEAASGAKYSNGKVSVWFKGEEALVEFIDESRTFRNCRQQN